MSQHLETYLRRAVIGVPSAQRAVIQAELRGNILLRSAVTDDSGKLTGVNLESESFSSALATAGIGLYAPALTANLGFTTAHAWDWAIRDNLIQPSLTAAKFGLNTKFRLTNNLELLQALRVLCNAAAHVTLESPSSSVVFRVTWKGSTSRIALNLDPRQALEFHEGVASGFKHPCER